MAIPSQTEILKYLLEIVADYTEFSRRQAKVDVCTRLNLSEDEQAQKTSSGALVYESRVGWSISWLSDAGYITRIRRGIYTISEAGKAVLARNLTLEDFASQLRKDKNERIQGAVNTEDTASPVGIVSDISPMEILDSTLQELQDQLAHELMNSILSIEGRSGDTFFEKVVTDLLEKMGYGKGTVTQASNDAGIDGIIKTDPLGFNPILIQAKRYSLDHAVGRPEIQGFAGALGSVTRGAFITTSRFSSAAVQFAASYPHADIVLIDGQKLTGLMIRYNLGVSVEREVSIKRIDNDYFES